MIILWLLEVIFVVLGILAFIGFSYYLVKETSTDNWHNLVIQFVALPWFIALVLHILRVL